MRWSPAVRLIGLQVTLSRNCALDPLPMPWRTVAVDHTHIVIVLPNSRLEVGAFAEAFDQSARV